MKTAPSGCTCERTTTIDFAGVPASVSRYSCETGDQAAELLGELIDEDEGGELVAAYAAGLAERFGDDRATLARAIQLLVQRTIAYVLEAKETFQEAETSLHRRAGDCDDHAVLVIVLARTLSIPARLVILRKNGQPVHAVAQLELSGEWQWAETTVAAELGEHPVEAARRLKTQRKDLEQ